MDDLGFDTMEEALSNFSDLTGSLTAGINKTCTLNKGFQFYYLPIMYIIVFVTGFIGNSVALWMFIFHMRPWSSITIYMFNLALADLFYVFSLPILIFYYFNKTDWIFGEVLCKLQRFIFHVNLYGSILFLTCISVHRYTGVVHPMRSLGRLKKKSATIVCVCVWIAVMAGISPILFFSRTGLRRNKTNTCYDTTSKELLHTYFIYSMGTTFFGFCIPFATILVCYGFIVKALISNDMRTPLRGKSVRLVIIVLAVFAISYLPFHVMKNLNLQSRLYYQGIDTCEWNRRVYAMYQVTRGLASLNSCVDPILYFLAGDTFRRRFTTAATRFMSRRGELSLPFRSEDSPLQAVSNISQNGDTSL
ncbi:P2Y purinoceptor 1-like isoform X1 [Pristis pectinata]|uniref:P2Y purinoceptor 1-like isoform X1 n=1 Tax=Pristis pectinata TaxID=685728 RepID=UPI00223D2A7E|nr:P2Y purinoceptor 1-like isoform X1 [Pristis pectinata]XP_051874895.1 P2Y purinoceptor 1-like isoform X1 [Pristis pectinata]